MGAMPVPILDRCCPLLGEGVVGLDDSLAVLQEVWEVRVGGVDACRHGVPRGAGRQVGR